MDFSLFTMAMGALVIGGSVTAVISLMAAPLGYQDEQGFHFGEPAANGDDFGNPS